MAKAKSEALASFKSKILGDVNNAKGQEYMEKIKKEFKSR